MNNLEQALKTIKDRGSIGLMTHVVVGYPSLDDTVKLVKIMIKAGVDIVELQIPFSDPLADGPTIMRACETSLRNGTKVKDAFKTMKALSSEVNTPLLFMAYYNTVFRYGVDDFCHDASKAGAVGLIVPDMPIDEEPYEHYYSTCKKYGLQNIQVLSPSSNETRLKINSKVVNGFVYCTSRQGTTGARQELAPELSAYLNKVKSHIKAPLAVGFGISSKKHLHALEPYADIAVVGSSLLNVVAESNNISKDVTKFIKNLRM